MTTIADRQEVAELVESSEHETRVAVRRAVERSGFTPAQLAEQAQRNSFRSISARLAWMALCDLVDFSG